MTEKKLTKAEEWEKLMSTRPTDPSGCFAVPTTGAVMTQDLIARIDELAAKYYDAVLAHQESKGLNSESMSDTFINVSNALLYSWPAVKARIEAAEADLKKARQAWDWATRRFDTWSEPTDEIEKFNSYEEFWRKVRGT